MATVAADADSTEYVTTLTTVLERMTSVEYVTDLALSTSVDALISEDIATVTETS